MTHKIKVSVAIVTYNHAAFIKETIESVLTQKTDFPFEIVIGDDCSSDETRNLIKKLIENSPHPVHLLFYDKKVNGRTNYLNVYNHCQGEYIAQLDGDDKMLPGKLQIQANYLDTHPECAFCGHAVNIIDKNSKQVGVRTYPEGVYDLNHITQGGCIIFHSSKMFRKSTIPPEGFDANRKYVGDLLWHIQNACYGKFGYITQILGAYRHHNNGASFSNNEAANIPGALVDQLYAMDYAKAHGASDAAYKMGTSRIYFFSAISYLRLKDFAKFKEHIKKAEIYTQSFWLGRWIWLFKNHPAMLYQALKLYLRYKQ